MTKGTCEIILKDVNTGEVKSVKHHNMLTNALNNILNPPATFVPGLSNISNWYNKALPIAQGALGGVLLFKDPLTEDANNIIPDITKGCVGHAGDPYTGSNSYRGTLNAAESGPISGGYKSVWDFPTNAANGTISAVALTSRWGGNVGLQNSLVESGTDLFDSVKNDGSSPASSYTYGSTLISSDSTAYFAGELSDSVLTFFRIPNSTEIDIANVRMSAHLAVNDSLNSPSIVWTPYTTTHSFGTYAALSRKADGCIFMCRDNNDSYKLDFVKITPTGLANEQQFSVGSGNDPYNAAYESDGYIYGLAGGLPSTKLFRVKESDGSIDYIDLPESTSSFHNAQFNGIHLALIGSNYYMIDGTAFTKVFTNAHLGTAGPIESAYLPKPYCYYFYVGSSNQYYVVPSVFLPYLGTINNLSTPVQKTATQTMKVIYTLTNG